MTEDQEIALAVAIGLLKKNGYPTMANDLFEFRRTSHPGSKRRVDAVIQAIECECNGYGISRDTAERILVHLDESTPALPAPQPDSVPQDSGERAAFEAWCDREGINRTRQHGSDGFAFPVARASWKAWRAALAQKAVPIAVADRPTPEPLTSNDFAVVRRSIGPTPPAPIASTEEAPQRQLARLHPIASEQTEDLARPEAE